MKRLFALLLLCASLPTNASSLLPEIYVTETPNANGGSYTVTINQPPAPPNDIWYLIGWGIINQDATSVYTGLSGWGAELVDSASWDAGITYEQQPFCCEDPLHIFTTGADGIGTFAQVFASTFNQAAVYWVSEYYASGLPATSSNFFWEDGAGNSTAFAIIANTTTGESLSCGISVNDSSGTGECAAVTAPAVPLPAAAWLFGSALLGLLGISRRSRAA